MSDLRESLNQTREEFEKTIKDGKEIVKALKEDKPKKDDEKEEPEKIEEKSSEESKDE